MDKRGMQELHVINCLLLISNLCLEFETLNLVTL